MFRPTAVVLGFSAFGAAHLLVVTGWTAMGGTGQPWFLNSGTAVALTAVVLLVAGVASQTLLRARGNLDVPLSVSSGAIAALAVTMVTTVRGNLYPLVFLVGAAICVVSATAGCLLARLFVGVNGPGTHQS